ncbi:MAG: response regulator transcription factor [Acidimicrobiia bacterium]|nr:response regulator transcription factor [Acidimicrobiia bacterium]MBT8215022.1 response regulator transcription factor [Acidimicrobiia bacterium]NNF68510.1 response regulator transcription factor [Acidimicrobiia bacterium]NNK92234.1 response regulator transcription factor [Acidimicrobiia bacterium]
MNESIKGGTVLLIEDDPDIADVVRLYVEKAGFRLAHAVSGRAGLDIASGSPIRAVLLDLGLPDMDGVDVCKELRAASDVPILILTARDSEIDKVLGLELGADDYVTKPFSPRELVARVKAVLRRAEEDRPGTAVVEVGGYRIDEGRREVVLPDGAVVRPTAREFDLAWYLATNTGLALSRGQILESVWGYDYFGETRTVDVHVRQLRKKVPGIPIETVWGVGYRMEG